LPFDVTQLPHLLKECIPEPRRRRVGSWRLATEEAYAIDLSRRLSPDGNWGKNPSKHDQQ
jgi:hypothetical protein